MAIGGPVGSSFVELGDAGFWVHDSRLEVWLRLLALHLAEPSNSDSVEIHAITRRIRDRWLLASKGFFGGCIPTALNEAVTTVDGKRLVRSAIELTLKSLHQAPPVLPRSILKLLGFTADGYAFDIETRHLIDVGTAFLDLIDGRITINLDFRVRMPGSDVRPQSS